jgi:N6-adenosine-specific RNA methylase IME4
MKRYRLILADPPWRYRASRVNGAAAKHYSTLSTKALCKLPIHNLTARDAVLLLWATWPLLPDAQAVMRSWGFAYKTGFPWIKITGRPQPSLFNHSRTLRPFYGIGWWVRGCSELVLVGVKGNASPPRESFVGLLSPNFQHSRKPESLYEYAEAFEGPRLELFARGPGRPGWDVFGYEAEGSILLPDIRLKSA